MLKYKNQLLAVLLSALLCVACSSDDDHKHTVKDDYVKPSLSEVNCENLDYHYEKCDRFTFISHIENCRSRYTPKLFQCYGAKAAGF